MQHAGPEALDTIEALLVQLRAVPSLVEKKRGVFYRHGKAFLHFHQDPTGMYADLRVREGDDFVRRRVITQKEQAAFVAAMRRG
ncbi:MAG TPA: hypothetical protein VGG43_14015 [Acidimicrobiales bacterium]